MIILCPFPLVEEDRIVRLWEKLLVNSKLVYYIELKPYTSQHLYQRSQTAGSERKQHGR